MKHIGNICNEVDNVVKWRWGPKRPIYVYQKSMAIPDLT